MKSKLLGREMVEYPYASFEGRRVTVTGGKGSIGRALVRSGLPPQGGVWTSLDLNNSAYQIYDALDCDILDYPSLVASLAGHQSDTIVHAAAHKHAPYAEDNPAAVADVNVRGTANVVRAALELGIDRLVFTSTCKAAQPETVYGASKLVGERIVLNAGFTVARLYNVIESHGNVFEIWDEAVRNGEVCKVAWAERYYIHMGEAVGFILSCLQREPGRYVPYAERIDTHRLYGAWLREHSVKNTGYENIPLRRGDRLTEPRWAVYEQGRHLLDGASRVTSPHD